MMDLRLDFDFVGVSDDPDGPVIHAMLNPERYTVNVDGDDVTIIDKLDPRRLCMSLKTLQDLMQKAMQLSVVDKRPTIEDADAYRLSRIEHIAAGIADGVNDDAFRNIIDEELTPTDSKHFVIMSLDLVGSTKLSQAVGDAAFLKIIQTYSREVALICDAFHGRVLKFMGDGAILYFEAASKLRRHDFAFDCALTLRDLVCIAFNAVLKAAGLPQLACRIGMDSGFAPVANVGHHATTNHMDIIGQIVNIAAKIEKHAPTNDICVGKSVVVNTHTMWLKHLHPIALPDDWAYLDHEGGAAYEIYRLDIPIGDGP